MLAGNTRCLAIPRAGHEQPLKCGDSEAVGHARDVVGYQALVRFVARVGFHFGRQFVNVSTEVVEQRLYQVGRSTTFLLFQRENALTNARNAELRAETDYNKALAEIDFLAGRTPAGLVAAQGGAK